MSTAVDPRIELCFASKLPHTTCWIEIEAPADNEPAALYAALRAGGWAESGIANLPPATKFDPATGKSAGYQYRERIFTRPGSQIFGIWSPEEKRRFMTEARAIFRRFGITRIPTWRKSLQDML
jgi:hypothetical protein